MAVVQVFSGFSGAGQVVQSDPFTNGIAFTMVPVGLGANEGYELSYLVLVDVPGVGSKELMGGIYDTKDIQSIPSELGESGLNLRVAVATPYSVELEIYVITRDTVATSDTYRQNFIESNLSAGVLVVAHGLGTTSPTAVTVWNNEGEAIIPNDVIAIDADSLSVDLSSFSPITGVWSIAIEV
jgi:hypothetical protein